MMVLRLSISILFIVVLSIMIFIPQLYTSSDVCGTILIPAIDERINQGVAIDVEICVLSNGSGFVDVVGVSSVGNDTVISLLVAFIMSQLISDSSLVDKDIVIRFIGRDINTVEGPSAGALITFAIASLISQGFIPSFFSGTGGINVDGSVENVGGIIKKIEALVDRGVRRIFIPASFYITSKNSIDELVFRYRNDLNIDVEIIPVTSIDQLFNRSINILEYTINTAPDDTIRIYAQNVFKSFESNALREFIDNNMTISQIIYRPEYRELLQQYVSVQTLYKLYRNAPPEYQYSYTRVNLLYLSNYLLRNIYYQIVFAEMDINEAIEYIDDIVVEINNSLQKFVGALTNLPDNLGIETYGLLLLYIDRLFDLIDIRDGLIELKENPEEITLFQLANLVARSDVRIESLEFWLELVNLSLRSVNTYTPRSEIDRDNIDRVASFLGIGINNIEEQAERLFKNIYRNFNISVLDGKVLDLLKLYTIYNELDRYSVSLKASTIDDIYRYALAINTIDPIELFIYDMGYMKVGNILNSRSIGNSLLGQIYIYAAWSLDLLSKTRDLLASGDIFALSIISTSASSAALALTLFTVTDRVDVPRGLDINPEDLRVEFKESIEVFAELYNEVLNTIVTIAIGINIVALILIARIRISYKI